MRYKLFWGIILLLPLLESFQCGKRLHQLFPPRDPYLLLDGIQIPVVNHTNQTIGITINISHFDSTLLLQTSIIQPQDSILAYYADSVFSNYWKNKTFSITFYNLQDTTFTKWNEKDINRVHDNYYFGTALVDKVADKVLKKISAFSVIGTDSTTYIKEYRFTITEEVFPIVFRKDYNMLLKFKSYYRL